MLHVSKALVITATGLVASTLIIGGCGDSGTPAAAGTTPRPIGRSTTVVATAPRPSVAQHPGAVSGGSAQPSESKVKAAQAAPIKPASDPAKQLPSLDRSEVRPGLASTAPAAAVSLARRAAVEWIAYRIDGKSPDPAVLPKVLWDSVPPAAPSVRVKGAARKDGMKAIEAHPQDGGWIVNVATQDTRVPTIVLAIKRAGGRMTVTEVSG